MYRRDFLRFAMVAGFSHSVMNSISAFGLKPDNELDRFGGFIGRQFRKTGFFRIEKDKRWWLVTPEGNAFLSFGINHLHPGWWKQDYNRHAWEKRLGLQNLDSPEFETALRAWFLRTCREYGFNTIGVHNQLSVINSPLPSMPYLKPIDFVDIPHWKTEVPDSNFLDVFAREFSLRCDNLAKEIAYPAKDDPFLIGYAMTDCPLFTEEDCRERPDVIGGAARKARIGWPRRLRNLGSDTPGKRVYVETVRNLYRDQISDFNLTYGTRFDSFDELLSAVDWRLYTDLSNGNEMRDNIEFLKLVVAKYYQTARDAIHRYDPNHMFIGDKINANTDSMDTILTTTSRFTDLVFYQMYGRTDIQESSLEKWSGIVEKPFINGDAAFTMITENMPRPFGPVADNIHQRAKWTEEFFRRAFSRPEFVGWHYCGLIDAPNQIEAKKDRQHSGLLDGYGEPYSELKKVLKSCSDQIYSIAIGG